MRDLTGVVLVSKRASLQFLLTIAYWQPMLASFTTSLHVSDIMGDGQCPLAALLGRLPNLVKLGLTIFLYKYPSTYLTAASGSPRCKR